MDFTCPQCQSSFTLPDSHKKSLATCPHCASKVPIAELETKVYQGPTSPAGPAIMEDTLGDDLEILGLIGRGGMGSVYRARQISLNREVAVKILPPHLAGDEQFVQRFHREAETLASLDHPQIVQIISRGDDQGIYYFVMELVEGRSLAQILKEEELSLKEKLRILKEVCLALDFAHRQGVIHRDIKPANILIRQDGAVKVSDFGVARIIGTPESVLTELTMTHMVVGTLKYMAPEQRTDSKSVDLRADVYSLGVMAYEMITGKEPTGRFDLPSQIDPHLDSQLDYLVEKALHPEVDNRFDSTAEMAELLTEIEESPYKKTASLANREGDSATAISRRQPVRAKGKDSKKFFLSAIAALVLLNVGLLSYFLWWKPVKKSDKVEGQTLAAGTKPLSKEKRGKKEEGKVSTSPAKKPDSKKEDSSQSPSSKEKEKNSPRSENQEERPPTQQRQNQRPITQQTKGGKRFLAQFKRKGYRKRKGLPQKLSPNRERGKDDFTRPAAPSSLPPGAKVQRSSQLKSKRAKNWQNYSHYQLFHWARNLEQRGRVNLRNRLCREMVKKEAKKFYDYFYRGYSWLKLGKYESAAEELTRYLKRGQKKHHQYLMTYYWKGLNPSFEKEKEGVNWKAFWQSWAFVSQLSCLAHYYRSRAWKELGKMNRALGDITASMTWAQNLQKFYPQFSTSSFQGKLYQIRGGYYSLKGQKKEAFDDYEKSRQIYRANPFLYLQWILDAFRHGEPKRAEKVGAQWEKEFSNYPYWSRFFQGLIKHLEGDLVKARHHYIKAFSVRHRHRNLFIAFYYLLESQRGRTENIKKQVEKSRLQSRILLYSSLTAYLPPVLKKHWMEIFSAPYLKANFRK